MKISYKNLSNTCVTSYILIEPLTSMCVYMRVIESYRLPGNIKRESNHREKRILSGYFAHPWIITSRMFTSAMGEVNSAYSSALLAIDERLTLNSSVAFWTGAFRNKQPLDSRFCSSYSRWHWQLLGLLQSHYSTQQHSLGIEWQNGSAVKANEIENNIVWAEGKNGDSGFLCLQWGIKLITV